MKKLTQLFLGLAMWGAMGALAVNYTMSEEVRVDTQTLGSAIDASTATDFAYGTFWGGSGATVTVTTESSLEVFAATSGFGAFNLSSSVASGSHTLTMSITGGSLGSGEETCSIVFDNTPVLTMSEEVRVDTQTLGTRINATTATDFAYGTFWGGSGATVTVTTESSLEVFAATSGFGAFNLSSSVASGSHTLTMSITGGSLGSGEETCSIVFDNTPVLTMSEEVRVDTQTLGTRINATTATDFAYGTFWGGEGATITVTSDDSVEVFAISFGWGVFSIPASTAMASGDRTLTMSITGGSLGSVNETCDITWDGTPVFTKSEDVQIDTKTPHTTIKLQTTDEIAYCLNWGAKDVAYVSVTATGREGYISEEVDTFEIYHSTDTGWLNSFQWDYSVKSVEELPRGPYTLAHTTYDADNVKKDELKCSVQLLPEPASLLALLSILSLLGLARKD